MSKTFLPENIDAYVRNHSVRESDLLRRLREETLKQPNPEMQINADQGKFLSLLIDRDCMIGIYYFRI